MRRGIEETGFQRASSTVNVIAGIGWITQREYGCATKELRRSYSDMKSLRSGLQDASMLLYPVKGFGTYDLVSKMTCCVAGLALHDAEMAYSEGRKQDVGILGTNSEGCLQTNLDYFRDFVEDGRRRGRASLFVNTLPSIPVAQAAIYFRFQGPLLYMTFPGEQIRPLLSHADRMILRGESPAMLALRASEQDAVCFVLRRAEDVSTGTALKVDDVIETAEKTPLLEEMMAALAGMRQSSGLHQ